MPFPPSSSELADEVDEAVREPLPFPPSSSELADEIEKEEEEEESPLSLLFPLSSPELPADWDSDFCGLLDVGIEADGVIDAEMEGVGIEEADGEVDTATEGDDCALDVEEEVGEGGCC